MPITSTETLYAHFLQHPLACTDTRNIQKDCIFFALKGPSFNGNTFAAQALASGAAFAVIDEPAYATDPRCLLVDDVLRALQDLARFHRHALKLPVVGITGSNGKTTTKELLAAVLSKKYRTLYTKGNLNNHIGVPLTLLSLDTSHEMAVIEMGANHQQEIALLSSIAEPNYGLITNVGLAHLEGFGGPEGVLKGKTELYDFLQATGGTAFVLADDERLVKRAAGLKKTVLYGTKGNPAIKGTLLDAAPFVRFSWSAPGIAAHDVTTQMVGDYNLPNLLAAITCGLELGVSPAAIDEAIAGYVPDMNRSQVIRKGSNTIIMDAYNANPSSMTAALRNFAAMGAPQKLVVLGDMLELGEEEQSLHQNIVNQLNELKLMNVLLVGPRFASCALLPGTISVTDSETAAKWIASQQLNDTLLLIKGSRGIRLEKVLEAL